MFIQILIKFYIMKIRKSFYLEGKLILISETASLDVDALCGFSELCPKELPVPGALEIVPELNKQAKFAKIRVGSKDAHPYIILWEATAEEPQLTPIFGYKNLDFRWNRHCIVGTKGFEFLPGINPEEYSFIVYKGVEPDKHPYGACYQDLADTETTGLIEYLLYNKIKVIIVGGLATSYCLKKTVLQLCATGKFRVFVNLAACRDLPTAQTEVSIEQMEGAGAIMFNGSADIKEGPK